MSLRDFEVVLYISCEYFECPGCQMPDEPCIMCNKNSNKRYYYICLFPNILRLGNPFVVICDNCCVDDFLKGLVQQQTFEEFVCSSEQCSFCRKTCLVTFLEASLFLRYKGNEIDIEADNFLICQKCRLLRMM